MKQLLLIFIGGGTGSILRYALSKLLNNSHQSFPFGTFAANILGSLLIGVILGMAAKNTSITTNHTLLLATGFCGGFTTFSTFAYENHIFLKTGDYTSFLLYSLSSLLFGFLAVFGGIFLTKTFL